MEMQQNTQEKLDLWLTVKIKDQYYGIDAGCVQSIFQLTQEVTPVPNSDKSIQGIIKMRNDIVTIIDLRTIMGIETIEEQQESFDKMLETRKQDHINWVKELSRCVEEDDDFRLATDPHKCAFGKWYDSYHTTNSHIGFQLHKIDEPHRLLHETAVKITECEKNCTQGEQEESCKHKHLEQATTVFVPQIIDLLDGTKDVFKQNFRKMCVVVSHKGTLKGLVVDEVNAVEKLEIIQDSKNVYSGETDALISHIAQPANKTEQVLILDIDLALSEGAHKMPQLPKK